MYKVSIIVPIYNEETRIRACVVSILNQTYENIELILVNDGSTDDSSQICNDYQEKDGRITVIHQQNQGPAPARNAGIKIASGAYIQFVDADDRIEGRMTERLVTQMKKGATLTICGYTHHTAAREVIMPREAGLFSQLETIKRLGALYEATLLPSPCNKMYDRKLIHEANITFPEAFSTGEDLLFNLAYLDAARDIYFLQESLYHYESSDAHSLTNRYYDRFLENQLTLHKEMRAFLEKHDTYNGENRAILLQMEVKGLIHAIENCFHERGGMTWSEQRDKLQTLLTSDAVKQILPIFPDTPYHAAIKRLIKQNALRRLALLFTLKKRIRQHFPNSYNRIKQRRKKEWSKLHSSV